MKQLTRCSHYDSETDTYIEEKWYRSKGGDLYLELSRPDGLPATQLWTRLTASLEAKR